VTAIDSSVGRRRRTITITAVALYGCGFSAALVLAMIAATNLGGLGGELPVYDPSAAERAQWSRGQAAYMWGVAAMGVTIVAAVLVAASLPRTARRMIWGSVLVVGAVVSVATVSGITWSSVLPPLSPGY
jgi:MFS family permease